MDAGDQPDEERVLGRAGECLAQARSGRGVAAPLTASLMASLAAVDALPFSNEGFKRSWSVTRALRLALFGADDREALEAAVSDVLSFVVLHDKGHIPLRGLILRSGDGLARPMPDNPWGIPADAELDEAVTRIWAGAAPYASPFVDELRRRVLGIALVDDHSGEPALGYLMYHERGYQMSAEERARWAAGECPPFDRRQAMAWEPFGDLSTFVGYPPSTATKTREGIPVPKALRALYRAHGGLTDGMWRLASPEALTLWSRSLEHDPPRPVPTYDDEVMMSDDLLSFFSYGDDRDDLFDLTGDLTDPWVRSWESGALHSGGTPFWDWFHGRWHLILKREPTPDELGV